VGWATVALPATPDSNLLDISVIKNVGIFARSMIIEITKGTDILNIFLTQTIETFAYSFDFSDVRNSGYLATLGLRT